jgi:hypothetical protein
MLGKNAVLPALALAMVLVAATQARAATISIENATGAAGGIVQVDIILATSAGESVAGTQNDILFDGAMANLGMASACRINPAISDDAEGCEDDPNSGPCKTLNRSLADVEGGRRLRGLVLSLSNTTLITPADSTVVLYTCDFTVPEGATGTIPLGNSNCGASDPSGGALAAGCVPGSITIQVAEPPTHTPTTVPVTNTPTRAPGTNTPRPNTPTNTRPPSSGGGDDDDGCQVVASPSSHLSWLLLAPAAFLVIRRRRR